MSKERLEDKLVKFRQHLALGYVNMDILNQANEIHELVMEQAKRVQKLENIIYQDERQAVLEGMYEQNKRYREALEFYADEGTYEVVETIPPTDEYQQPIEPVFKTVPIIYYDKGKEARKALEE